MTHEPFVVGASPTRYPAPELSQHYVFNNEVKAGAREQAREAPESSNLVRPRTCVRAHLASYRGLKMTWIFEQMACMVVEEKFSRYKKYKKI